jgi:hypothetical protein
LAQKSRSRRHEIAQIEQMVSVAEFGEMMSTKRDTVHAWIRDTKIHRVLRVGKISRRPVGEGRRFLIGIRFKPPGRKPPCHIHEVICDES